MCASVSATLPEAVFPKDKVQVQVLIETTPGFVGRDVELDAEGRRPGTRPPKKIVLKGSQFEELSFIPQQSGGLVNDGKRAVSPLPGEATEKNNKANRTVKIIDEKIRVLYVEGKPRWEYRYLRAVLQRDHRMNVKFLLTEGDPDLAKAFQRPVYREDAGG